MSPLPVEIGVDDTNVTLLIPSTIPTVAADDLKGYLRNHWEALAVYLRDGRLPIDNNGVERLMKQHATVARTGYSSGVSPMVLV